MIRLNLQMFGGRGASSSAGGSRGGYSVKTVMTQGGQEVHLTNPLVYGKDDPYLTGESRRKMEDFENRKANAKIEWGYILDKDGNVVTEHKGGRGSVSFTYNQLAHAKQLSHIHPRGKGEEGYLGGTFSGADTNSWVKNTNITTMRAKANEGTYSISKGKNFDSQGFLKYRKEQSAINTAKKEATKKQLATQYYKDKDYNKYVSGVQQAFNDFLVDEHNSLLKGAKTYGYNYTLERKK